MITQIGIVGIYVNDQDKAIDFYTNTLGFSVTTDADMGDGMRWVSLAPPKDGAEITLATTAMTPDPNAKVGGYTNIILYDDDIQQTYNDLTAKGVSFHQEPKTEFWGTWTIFGDPDGNQFMLVQMPSQANA